MGLHHPQTQTDRDRPRPISTNPFPVLSPADFSAHYPQDAGAYLISYSGDYASSMLLDITLKLHPGKRIIPWFRYFLPGLDLTSHLADLVRARYNLRLYTSLCHGTINAMRMGLWCTRGIPDLTFPPADQSTSERQARSETDVIWIGYGYRDADSKSRAELMVNWPNGINLHGMVFAPLKFTRDSQAQAYCADNGIPIMTGRYGLEGVGAGIDLTQECMVWLKRAWPMDYSRVLRVFPRAETTRS